MKRSLAVLAAALAVSVSLCAQSKQKIYNLSIGDPERRTRDARVTLDAATDSATGG